MNVIQKEAKMKLKYKNLSIEIQPMWNMKLFVIPAISGAMRTVIKVLKISGNNIMKEFYRCSKKQLYYGHRT
jgi:hypothetical protein